MNQRKNSGQGRGWHGDSAGHAKAGKKGGQARARSNKSNQSNSAGFDYDNDNE